MHELEVEYDSVEFVLTNIRKTKATNLSPASTSSLYVQNVHPNTIIYIHNTQLRT